MNYTDKMQKIRLSQQAIDCITQDVLGVDPNAKTYIFGSRADLNKKGGDIDILIISKIFDFKDAQKLRIHLQNVIGEQKIDVVYSRDHENDPFIQIALETGVEI